MLVLRCSSPSTPSPGNKLHTSSRMRIFLCVTNAPHTHRCGKPDYSDTKRTTEEFDHCRWLFENRRVLPARLFSTAAQRSCTQTDRSELQGAEARLSSVCPQGQVGRKPPFSSSCSCSSHGHETRVRFLLGIFLGRFALFQGRFLERRRGCRMSPPTPRVPSACGRSGFPRLPGLEQRIL